MNSILSGEAEMVMVTVPARSGLDPATNSLAEFSTFLRADLERWARVIREVNIRME